MEHLMQPNEILSLSRPTSVHVQEEDINIFIDESEQMDIIPAIGAELYLDLLANLDDKKYAMLLDGGYYEGLKGEKKIFKGLKTSLAYFVYARLVKNDGKILGQSGFLSHNDEYGSKIEDKQKYATYNDAMNVAKRYLSDVLEYLKLTRTDFDKKARVRNNGTRILAIGD
ncbi:hypothetical protein [uncultured Bacteroides sp.]|uniref:DUF6712 family protein n=1 Tax=uncultured Bacteroides sp. TaxID=162156 RepID=UPI002AAB3288|nr:hypothetical protein [uncultured Bacteroides sp.]